MYCTNGMSYNLELTQLKDYIIRGQSDQGLSDQTGKQDSCLGCTPAFKTVYIGGCGVFYCFFKILTTVDCKDENCETCFCSNYN